MLSFQAKSMVIASTPENQRVSFSPSSCFIYSLKTSVSSKISKVNARIMYFYTLNKLFTLMIDRIEVYMNENASDSGFCNISIVLGRKVLQL